MAEVVSTGDHAPRIIWGAARIGKVIGRGRNTVSDLARRGMLPVRRIGGQWAAEEGHLIRFVGSAGEARPTPAYRHDDDEPKAPSHPQEAT